MTLVEVCGPPRPSFVFGGFTAFFHVIGRGPSALEKGVIVAIMDHIRIANNYRREHVLIVRLRTSRMLICVINKLFAVVYYLILRHRSETINLCVTLI